MKYALPAMLLISSLMPAGAPAQEHGGALEMEHAYTNLGNMASLQRGAKLFINYCLGCHSLQYQRYVRLAEDLGFTQEQVENKLMFTADKIFDPMDNAMPAQAAENWFGIAPPDLTLVARSRGVDWIYNYLQSFYVDPSRPLGWNNAVFENASMPNPLWMLQGIQAPVFETHINQFGDEEQKLVGLEIIQEGRLSPEQFDRLARDLTTFLEYAGEPAKMKRESLGIWVLLFVALFTFLAFLLKREYWRDVH